MLTQTTLFQSIEVLQCRLERNRIARRRLHGDQASVYSRTEGIDPNPAVYSERIAVVAVVSVKKPAQNDVVNEIRSLKVCMVVSNKRQMMDSVECRRRVEQCHQRSRISMTHCLQDVVNNAKHCSFSGMMGAAPCTPWL